MLYQLYCVPEDIPSHSTRTSALSPGRAPLPSPRAWVSCPLLPSDAQPPCASPTCCMFPSGPCLRETGSEASAPRLEAQQPRRRGPRRGWRTGQAAHWKRDHPETCHRPSAIGQTVRARAGHRHRLRVLLQSAPRTPPLRMVPREWRTESSVEGCSGKGNTCTSHMKLPTHCHAYS